MKNSTVLFAILIALSFTGCSQFVYTHLQAMQRYKTQQDVVKAFGLPNQKKVGNDVTEWLYDESAYTRPARGKGDPFFHNTNNNTVTVTEFTGYNKYVKFSFDSKGNVLNFDSAGVDFSKKQANPIGTVFVVLGAVLLTAAIILAAMGFSGISY